MIYLPKVEQKDILPLSNIHHGGHVCLISFTVCKDLIAQFYKQTIIINLCANLKFQSSPLFILLIKILSRRDCNTPASSCSSEASKSNIITYIYISI
jgi:hypothetical protein